LQYLWPLMRKRASKMLKRITKRANGIIGFSENSMESYLVASKCELSRLITCLPKILSCNNLISPKSLRLLKLNPLLKR
jgi:hypothetical protein